ncbi:hypothetical protein CRENBAI_014978 [Crenichthys baileyi]|uniref:Uncharacterized protein n=1 Tax=Crenichthys baileyi TaxID=28760 RepID=A0AAV9RAM0_9TELE
MYSRAVRKEGVSLPNYPAAPKKLQSCHDTNILNNAYPSGLVERSNCCQGRETLTPNPQYGSTTPQRRDLSTVRSRHAVTGCVRAEILHGYTGPTVAPASRMTPPGPGPGTTLTFRSRFQHCDDASRSRYHDDAFRSGNGR